MANKKDIIRRKCVGINKITFQIIGTLFLPFVLEKFGIVEYGDMLTAGIGFLGFGLRNILNYKYQTSKKIKAYLENIYFTIILVLASVYLVYFTIRNYDTN